MPKSLEATATELAEEHLQHMRTVPWHSFAELIRTGRYGETFGCVFEGVYFDVGDNAAWAERADGNIILTAHATAESGQRAERSAVISRP